MVMLISLRYQWTIFSALCQFLAILRASTIVDVLSAKAWQSETIFLSPDGFPEFNKLADPDTSISFSGGGSRSFVASIGVLAALHELDLIKNIRYVSGVSGGSWATAVLTYAQHTTNDGELFGEVLMPNVLSRYLLKKMHPNCARRFASTDVIGYAVLRLISRDASSISDAWIQAVYHAYLKPAEIPSKSLFSWTTDTVYDIKQRNPVLSNITFLLPKKSNRPFPIFTTTLVGPTEVAPYLSYQHNYTRIEVTPLYVGQLQTSTIQYSEFISSLGTVKTQTVGGFIEPFALQKDGDAPATGLSRGVRSGLLSLSTPTTAADIMSAGMHLEQVIASSSFAPGTLLAALPAGIALEVTMETNYWSPATPIPTNQKNFIGDGGSSENMNLISMLQRRVKKIVLIINSVTPLQPAHKWNVLVDDPTEDQIDIDVAAFFGVLVQHESTLNSLTIDLSKNQVFAKDRWSDVALELQARQMAGKGIVATFQLVTVENHWWGIPGGLQVQLTILYMGRCHLWEKELPHELQQLVVPKSDASDLSNTIEDGPFRGFPHFPTTAGTINFEKSNLLANLMGWIVLQNSNEFQKMFS